ncbi:hypothetical protein GLYMA_18G096000v4 [Glycine max]|uniref:Uncharacterized protein n=1 Tax=Glycine max TaxID=3847 RepID=A0A0R0F6U1_SOYBN|nr:hypothetical protein GLYMA_18G096000v4 [Glycine max]
MFVLVLFVSICNVLILFVVMHVSFLIIVTDFSTVFLVLFIVLGYRRRSIQQKNIHRGFSERNDYWFGIWRGGNHMYIGLRWSFFCSGNT